MIRSYIYRKPRALFYNFQKHETLGVKKQTNKKKKTLATSQHLFIRRKLTLPILKLRVSLISIRLYYNWCYHKQY